MTRRLVHVTSEAHDVLRTALALPAGDRAELAAVLLDSLDGELETAPDFDEEWLAEIAARARRALSEPATSDLPWDEVRAEISARLRSR